MARTPKSSKKSTSVAQPVAVAPEAVVPQGELETPSNKQDKVASISASLAELLSLTAPKSPENPTPLSSSLSEGLADPAISQAKRNKNTVTLGFDPEFAPVAEKAAKFHSALQTAKSLFEEVQGDVREYGKTKRNVYNKTYRVNVTTVNVPYFTDAFGEPQEDGTAPKMRVQKQVQVICSNKYSVTKDAVLGLEVEFGDTWGKLFVKDETKSLKPNAEDLFKQILKDVGLPDDRITASMSVLFDTNTTVATREDYEAQHELLPEEKKLILSQIVTRAQPGLKFPG